MAFCYLPHTADLKARVEGATLDELYASAVDLLRDAVVGDSPVEPREAIDVELPTGDREERFFHFVRELVFHFDARGFIPASAEPGTDDTGAGPARVGVRGERFDASRHHCERQIKALTRHGFSLESGPDGWRVDLLFDL